MVPEKNKIEDYRLYVYTFIGLAIFTLLSVWITHLRIAAPLMVSVILTIAVIQAVIVLLYNMHLKFHDKILTIFVGLVFSLIFLLIIITTIDFIDR